MDVIILNEYVVAITVSIMRWLHRYDARIQNMVDNRRRGV